MQITYDNADQFKGVDLLPKDGGNPVKLVGKTTLHDGKRVLLLSDNKWLTPKEMASRYTTAEDDALIENLRGAIIDKYLDEVEAIGGRIVHTEDGEPLSVDFEVMGNAYNMTAVMAGSTFSVAFYQYRDISPDGDYSSMPPIDTKSLKWKNIPLDDLLQTPQFSNKSPEDVAKAIFSRYGFLGVVR